MHLLDNVRNYDKYMFLIQLLVVIEVCISTKFDLYKKTFFCLCLSEEYYNNPLRKVTGLAGAVSHKRSGPHMKVQ